MLSKKNNKKINNKKTKKRGAGLISMGESFRDDVLPTIPSSFKCPVCDEKHLKKNLIYDVTSLRNDFRIKNPNGIRVRSYKLGSRRRYYSNTLFVPTVFYFCCMNCSLHFTFRNQKSENMIRGKESNK